MHYRDRVVRLKGGSPGIMLGILRALSTHTAHRDAGKDCNVLLTCNEALSRLDDFLDRELTPGEMDQVQAHLLQCAHCAEIHAYEKSVITEIRRKLSRIDVPPTLLARIMERVALG